MTTLTAAQVYGLARGAGWDPAGAVLMVAIGFAESGLRTDARGDVGIQTSTWGPSIGIWQIRSLKADTGTGRPRDASRLTDPHFNASAARSIFKSQGLTAWSTYSNGAYRQFLGRAASATSGNSTLPNTGVSATPVVSTTGGGGGTTAQPVEFIGGGWDPLNWPGYLLGAVGSAAGDAANSAAGAIWLAIRPFLITSLFVSAGLVLVIIGAQITASPVKIPGLPGGFR